MVIIHLYIQYQLAETIYGGSALCTSGASNFFEHETSVLDLFALKRAIAMVAKRFVGIF